MSNYSQEYLTHLLKECSIQPDSVCIDILIKSALSGLTHGANNFLDQSAKMMQPADLKNHLQCYPAAHILVGIIKFYELNKDTQIIRDLINSLLDSIEAEKNNKTLH